MKALRWRHNDRDGVSNHQSRDCLLNRLFNCRLKKTSKPRVTGLCAGNSPGTGEFPAQMASYAENVSIWWRHNGIMLIFVTEKIGRYFWRRVYMTRCQDYSRSILHWRHNERGGVSDHQPRDCLLNRLFKRRSKKTSKLRVTGLCAVNSPVTGEFPVQRAGNAENVSIWWRHHEYLNTSHWLTNDNFSLHT